MAARRRRPSLKPRKSPHQERAVATVEAILQASAYILIKGGYSALTTNRIAEKAGVNIASLYQYFPNKQAIFVELCRRHVEEVRTLSATILEQPGGSESARTRRAIQAVISAHAVAPELHRIFTSEAARLDLPPFETEADAKLAEREDKWLKTTKRKNAALAAWLANTAIHAVIHAAFAERPDIAQDPALSEELTKLVVRFLR